MDNHSVDFGIEIGTDFDDFFNPFEDADNDADGALAPAESPSSDLSDESFGKATPVDEEAIRQTKTKKNVDTRTPKERLDDLMHAMQPQRHTVLGILRMCKNRTPVSEVNAFVEETQVYNYSVFSPAAICTMLEAAGGLVRVIEDGTPYDEVEIAPQTVLDEDGIECIVPGEPPEMFWQTTEDGVALFEAEDPAGRLRARLEADEVFLPAYKRTLQMASTEAGATRDALYDALEPFLGTVKPRVYSPLFVERLSKCDAVEWRGAWFITDLGRECLGQMTDVPDLN